MSENRKSVSQLTLLCTLAYFISYITRINYSAVIIEMVSAEGFTKTAASMALTGSAVTYGIGQVASGFLGDRVKPQWLIFSGILISSFMNILVPLFARPYAMLVFWCINGFAQALMWPPMVKIMSSLFTPEQYKKACVRVSWGSSLGTIAVYLFAPVIISIAGWRAVFCICSVSALLFSLVWIKAYSRIQTKFSQPSSSPITSAVSSSFAVPGIGMYLTMGMIMTAIVAQGYLRDGVTTWMPSYISETYNLGSTVSILTGVAMPVFSILCFKLSETLNRNYIKNEVVCGGTIFAVGGAAAVALWLIGNVNPAVSVILSTVITGCMHGVNLMLICMLPPYFAKYGNVAFVSGLLNSCTYVGSALSSYGMAALAQGFGWTSVILSWGLVAIFGTAVCFVCAKGWQRIK